MTRQRCNSMERESDSRYPSPPSEGARCAHICHQEPRLRLRVGSPGEISPWSFLKVFNAHTHANSELVLLNASVVSKANSEVEANPNCRAVRFRYRTSVSGPCNVRLATTRKRLLHHTSTARGVRKSAQNCPCENPVKIGFLDIHRWR